MPPRRRKKKNQSTIHMLGLATKEVQERGGVLIPYHYLNMYDLEDGRRQQRRTAQRVRENRHENEVEQHMALYDIGDEVDEIPESEKESARECRNSSQRASSSNSATSNHAAPNLSSVREVSPMRQSFTMGHREVAVVQSRSNSPAPLMHAARKELAPEADLAPVAFEDVAVPEEFGHLNIRESRTVPNDQEIVKKRDEEKGASQEEEEESDSDDDYTVDEERVDSDANFEAHEFDDAPLDERESTNLPPIVKLDGSAHAFKPESFVNLILVDDRMQEELEERGPRGARERQQEDRLYSTKFRNTELYSVDFTAEKECQNEVFFSAYHSEPYQFIYHMIRNFEKPSQDAIFMHGEHAFGRSCSERCACKYMLVTPMSLSHSNINPLFLAVVHATDEFFYKVIFAGQNSILQDVLNHLQIHQDHEMHLHYNFAINNWLLTRIGPDKVSVVDFAADLGKISLVNLLLTHEAVRGALSQAMGNYRSSRKYDVPFYKPAESLLSRIVAQPSFLESLSRENLEYVINTTTTIQLAHVVDTACEKGALDTIELLKQYMPDEISKAMGPKQYADWEYWGKPVPGKIQKMREADEEQNQDASPSNASQPKYYGEEPPPAAHYLVLNKHFDKFANLDVEEKLAVDYFQFSALVPMLVFDDNQIRDQLKFFRGVYREDFFTFLAHIIFERRSWNLLETGLQMCMANSSYFYPPKVTDSKFPLDVYEAYGLPEYIPLPMETALCKTGDMRLVWKIAELYGKQAKYADALIEEDCLRCIRAVQDAAHSITDQIRLAVILFMLPFVNPYTATFNRIIKMHLRKHRPDNLASHVIRYLVPVKDNKKVWRRGAPVKWAYAMEMARDTTPKFNGRLEKSGLFTDHVHLKPVEVYHQWDRYRYRFSEKKILTSQEKINNRRHQKVSSIESQDEVYLSLSLALAKLEIREAAQDSRLQTATNQR